MTADDANVLGGTRMPLIADVADGVGGAGAAVRRRNAFSSRHRATSRSEYNERRIQGIKPAAFVLIYHHSFILCSTNLYFAESDRSWKSCQHLPIEQPLLSSLNLHAERSEDIEEKRRDR
jgi:hypothetical protein